jgi:ferritin-like protein
VRDAEEADPDTMIEAAKIAHDELNHHATVVNMLMEGPKND